MTDQKLHREVFAVPRVSEFFEVEALQLQTGVDRKRFAEVVVKELMDNALDAAEAHTDKPEVTLTVVDHLIDGDGYFTITVADNGPGIPSEVIRSILDFTTLTSDKRAYRSITRGQQGNALKTILGIPTALGGDQPVIIESMGVRHSIHMNIDMANELKTIYSHKVDESICTGTTISVSIPSAGQAVLDPDKWGRAYSLVNPHALVRVQHGHLAGEPDEEVELAEVGLYKPRTDRLDKPTPADPTSPHWYDEEALAKLIAAHNRKFKAGGYNKPVGEFIREFKGLSGSAKASAVARQLRSTHLSDFSLWQHEIITLLDAMKAEAKVPPPQALGSIDLAGVEDAFDEWYGTGRTFRRRGGIVHDGVAWGIDVVVSETSEYGAVYYAVNYAPTYSDPLSSTALESPAEEVYAHGVNSFLIETDAHPQASYVGGPRAVLVHITCPAPQFLDKGKTMMSVPEEVAAEISRTLWLATNKLYKEMRAREATGRKREKEPPKPKDDQMSLEKAMYLVMEESIAKTSGNGAYVFPARNLFYVVRDKIQEYGHTTRKLEYARFDQILVKYRQEKGEILGLYRDPRGVFHEPHTGEDLALGTREVAAYTVPEWTFIRVGYIEKEGVWPGIQTAKIPERFDMAFAMGKGRPTEAVRNLFDLFDKRHKFELYVFHDADSYGYGIAKNMREATERMLDYNVKAIDIGLTVEQAMELEMRPEVYDDQGELDSTIEFSEMALEWFSGTWKEERLVKGNPKTFRVGVKRVELNAFTMPEFIAWVERRLTEEITKRGGQIKMRPPIDVLKKRATAENKELIKAWITEQLDLDGMAQTLADEFKDRVLDVDFHKKITEGYAADNSQWWKKIVDDAVSSQHDKHQEALLKRITEIISQQRR